MLRSAGDLAVLFALAIVAPAGCSDPARDEEIDALGPEAPGVEPGPKHRPGQPCLACHGPRGPANPQLAVAGTIYRTRTGTDPLVGGTVTVLDAAGQRRDLVTNEAGNFFLNASEWTPAFPLFAQVGFVGTDGKKETATMQTRIGQRADCGYCHQGPRPKGDNVHMAPVWLEDK